jgi:broad specificity phosphatase PhoE
MILVRHARALVRKDEDPHSWPLDPEHIHQIEALAPLVPKRPVVCSDMQRAIGTAGYFGEPIVDSRLAEVERPWTDDFEPAVARYLAGQHLDGWEPQDDARARFRAVVAEHGNAIYVSHGTVLTLYVASVVADLDSFEFWQSLASPGAWQIDDSSITRLG